MLLEPPKSHKLVTQNNTSVGKSVYVKTSDEVKTC